jgi:di/tricarboxylate transporter
MTFAAWLTVAVAMAAVVAMAREWLEPPLALGGALGLLLITGVISPAQGLAGFSNPAVATVALLLVIAASMERSPWLRWLTAPVFGDRPGRRAVLRSGTATAVLSGFVANTPLCAVLIPAAKDWAERHGESAARLLMPLSFAAIMGGAATLVGTSTNLVVHGMLLEQGLPGLGMFELAPAAVPLAAVGVLYLVFVGYVRLSPRRDVRQSVQTDPKRYSTWLRVTEGGSLVGQKVSRLRHLPNVYVAGVERAETLKSPVGPDWILAQGDSLLFVGLVDQIAEVQAMDGLEADSGRGALASLGEEHLQLVEAVVSPSAPVVGRSVRDSGFRARYDAVVVAVHRHGERIEAKIGDIVLHAGDTLLLQTGSDFLGRWRHSRDFYLVSEAGRVSQPVAPGDWLEPVTLGLVVALTVSGLATLLEATVGGVLILILTRRLEPVDLWSSLDWATLVTMATAIGLGQAMVASGAAGALAGVLTGWTSASGPYLAVGGLFLAASLLTEVITNVAAAALLFPVAVAAAVGAGTSVQPLAVAIALGASAAFLTPVGYQTNTMVAGAAGYTFGDFFRVGLPLKLLYVAGGTLLIPFFWSA